jgi:hypothetical protein
MTVPPVEAPRAVGAVVGNVLGPRPGRAFPSGGTAPDERDRAGVGTGAVVVEGTYAKARSRIVGRGDRCPTARTKRSAPRSSPLSISLSRPHGRRRSLTPTDGWRHFWVRCRARLSLALVGQIGGVGTVFRVFGFLLLVPLALLGIATFERTLQLGIEDIAYARRINTLRRFYFRPGLELDDYLMIPVADHDLSSVIQPGGLVYFHSRWQPFLTNAWVATIINSFLSGVLVGFVAGAAGGQPLHGPNSRGCGLRCYRNSSLPPRGGRVARGASGLTFVPSQKPAARAS